MQSSYDKNRKIIYTFVARKFAFMESLYKTHQCLVENLRVPVRRALMDEIDWHDRLIGIKGTRGVGKTTFLLQYAKEHFEPTDRSCLYINMNNFYFTHYSLVKFAGDFIANGGRVLLIDQMFKYSNWSQDLRECYFRYPELQIIFTGSSVMRLKEENPLLRDLVKVYYLRGFSFREYLNLEGHHHFHAYSLQEILRSHEQIAQTVLNNVNPLDYFADYLHHGFYPFYLEKRNFDENLLKTMNMMIEVDILFIQQIELKYLTKIKQLFHLIAIDGPVAPNVSKLSNEVQTSRATVMNYIKYLTDARLLNMVYPRGEKFPKKPSRVMMHNSNLLFAMYPSKANKQTIDETFFMNTLYKDHKLYKGDKNFTFGVDDDLRFRVCSTDTKLKVAPDVYYAVDGLLKGSGNTIPLWLFGFLY